MMEIDLKSLILEELQGYLLRFLSYKPRTEWEMRLKAEEFLRKEDFSKRMGKFISAESEPNVSLSLTEEEKQELIEKVLDWFLEKSLVNDLDYALSYIEEQKGKKEPKGPLYIRDFLRKKGISTKNCEEALEKSYSNEEEEVAISKTLAHVPKSKHGKNMFSMFQRRGFHQQIISALIDLDSKKI